MDLGKNIGHLTYSTLVHPGDTWEEMWDSLTRYVPQVKERVSPNDPFGVSLRLSAESAALLVNDAEERNKLKQFFADNDMYLYTVNAFVYGPFKGNVVKERVYEPDWSTEQRKQYTINVAEVLADVCVDGVSPTIQSPPLAYKGNVTDATIAAYTQHTLETVIRLVELEERTGKTIRLALEPEPYCFLETTDEVVDYFTNHLYAEANVARLSEKLGITPEQSLSILHKHLGIVFDICHQAVEFEDISASLQKLVDAGIPIFKLQEAAAMRVPSVNEEVIELLTRYADTIYLTQTIEKMGDKLNRFLNLEDAIEAWKANPEEEREWRIHFHVPVFLETLGLVETTRFAIEDALKFHKATPLSEHLEIETYTWDVLPEELKTGDIVDYVTLELDWVKSQLV